MAKMNVAFTLDEETNDELEKFAKAMGISKSAAANQLLRATLLGEGMEVIGNMFGVMRQARKRNAKSREMLA